MSSPKEKRFPARFPVQDQSQNCRSNFVAELWLKSLGSDD
jgi:hypothetical protein